jgi:anthranilate phosphoribosyltransferase
LRLGCKHALIVYGEDGMDEISLSAPTLVCEVLGSQGDLREYRVTPEDVGLTRRSRDAVHGGDAAFNAELLRDTLAGKLNDAHAEMVNLNAGAALLASERVGTLAEGVKLARETLRAGRAVQTLEAVAALSQAA